MISTPVVFHSNEQGTLSVQYEREYRAVVSKLGKRAPGRNIVRWGLANGHKATNGAIGRSLAVLSRMLHPAPAVVRVAVQPKVVKRPIVSKPAPVFAPASGGGLSSVPGVPASFAACVALHESSDGTASSNVYGIIPASGYNVAGDSLAQQKQVFAQIYARDGVSAWAPYDGC